MTKSSSSIFRSLEYLFQKKSSNREQHSPFAPFSVALGVAGEQGFDSQTAPKEQPQRKKIFLDYNSTYSLFDSTQLALTIAKLQMEGFEVAFIFNATRLFSKEDPILVKKEDIDDLHVANYSGSNTSIFKILDSFKDMYFSQLDHKESAKQLKLASDESIILSYDQFEKIHSISSQEHWADDLEESSKSHLSYNFFKGSVESKETYEEKVDYIKKNPITNAPDSGILQTLFNHKDFDINHQQTLEFLKDAIKKDFFSNVPELIENTNVLIALFDKISSPELDFNIDQRDEAQRNILKSLWFKHPNFEDVISRAQSLQGFKYEPPAKIADSIFENSEIQYYLPDKHCPPDFFKRLPSDNQPIDCWDLPKILTAIIDQKKGETLSGEEDQFKFIPTKETRDGKEYLAFNFIYGSPQTKLSSSLNLGLFIKLFSNAEFNQHFELTEQFGDKIIDCLKNLTLSDAEYLYLDNKFLEQLNEDQKKQFLDQIKAKASSLNLSYDNSKSEEISYRKKTNALITLSNFLDLPEAKKTAIDILINLKENHVDGLKKIGLNFKLTPEFQELLIEMHDFGEIDLKKIKLPANSRIYAKFDKDQIILQELDEKYAQITLRNIYLENFDIFGPEKKVSRFFGWDKNKISSQPLKTSPLQITLFNLNQESLDEIKEKVKSEELDASKILSVSIFEIERGNPSATEKEDERKKLLDEFTKLFPNLKHLRINEKNRDIAESSIKSLDSKKKITLETYSKIKIEDIVRKKDPELTENIEDIVSKKDPELTENFSASNAGDAIFMCDGVLGSVADKDTATATFSMKKTGKIINRPADNQASLYIRDASHKINPNFAGLQDDLFVDVDESKPISLKENASITKFSSTTFEAKKTKLALTNSPTKTICSFSKTLGSGKKTALPSISPDNKIIGYFTEPSSAKVQFFKDESGFYFAQSRQRCEIHYLIEGKELESKTPTKTKGGLSAVIQNIITDYVGENSANFPNSVRNDQYQLPTFTNQNQFLDDLFNIENKGSCRHRVAALAHKFEKKDLKCGKDFRIIGVNRNHVLMEVKKQDNDWVTLDLGGSNSANLIEAIATAPQHQGSGKSRSLLNLIGAPAKTAPQSTKLKITKFLGAFSALCSKLGGFFCIPTKNSNQEQEPQASATLVIENTSTPQETIGLPSINPSPRRENLDQSLTSSSLREAIIKISQPKKVKDLASFEDNFKEFIATDKSSSLLLTTNHGEELKNHLLQISNSRQPSTTLDFTAFFASSPQNLAIKKSTINISEEEKSADKIDATIKTKTQFSSFLENAKNNPTKKHALIIDWKNFDDKERVAFNSMFDEADRTIDGEKIPKNVKIICIDKAKQKIIDPSISSRFNAFYDLSAINKSQLQTSSNQDSSSAKKIEFDGEGFTNWKEKLFGRIVVNGDNMEWQKSDFVKTLEALNQGKSDAINLQLNFKNFSSTQQQEMKIFFEQAQALGLVNYNNYEIKIPPDLTIKFSEKEFEFTEVTKSFGLPKTLGSIDSSQFLSTTKPTLKIYQDIQASAQLLQDIHLINSHLFDQLLIQPKVEGNQYQEELGLIAKAKESSSTLKLFLSEDLSKQQLYCLLNQAKQHEVSLELSLAKGVEVPDPSLNQFIEKSTISTVTNQEDSGAGVFSAKRISKQTQLQPQESQSSSRIIITNNIEESLNSLKSSKQFTGNINLVNIEDVLYGDLFEKPKYQLQQSSDGSQYFAFSKIENAVKAKLEARETVILKGQFSNELLSLLHPQILDLEQKFSNLHFIIEDKSISSTKQESDKLSWLDPSLYKIKYSPQIAKEDQEIVREKYSCVANSIPANSQEESEKFIEERKNKLAELISSRSTLQIVGNSGVGKSSLFREIKENGLVQKNDVAVYEELTSFEKWANDTSGKPKILVIDEFNVDGSTNFTMFRDLANNPNSSQRIFYKEKFYDLDENHKVVFLGNPRSYGNRYEQKLFSDCSITEWRLQDFPVSYIYENILKKPIFEGFSNEVKEKITEDEFKKIADEKIKKYKGKNQGEHKPQDDKLSKETVRELQEKVLKEIAKRIEPLTHSEVANNNFIATSSNQENIDELRSAIQIRQLQKRGEFPPNCLGTCGVIFEGDSGVGKSVMIEAVLEERGIKKINSLEALEQQIETSKSEKVHFYYKIPATLPIDQVEKQLIKAFELGVIVVFDEMNTRINEGLEKTINALLTGQHPKDSSIKSEPGFMLISSINGATNAGRSNLGTAIESRSNIIFAKSLSDYKTEDFEKIIKNWIDKENEKSEIKRDISENLIKECAQEFKKIASEGFNLRSLKLALPEILEKFEIESGSKNKKPNHFQPIIISSSPSISTVKI